MDKTAAGTRFDDGNDGEEPAMDRRSEIVSRGNQGFIITCAECGEKAVEFGRLSETGGAVNSVFQTGSDPDPYLCDGITCSQSIPPKDSEPVIALLRAGNLRKLNRYMRANCGYPEGIDAYCPDCGLAYCRSHYRPIVIFADDNPGWYESTEGTCPRGHCRTIDD